MKEGVKKFLGRYNDRNAPIFLFALVVLFWTIFDSLLQYITPLLIEERGFSKSMIGFIIGTSSITGAFFDLLICRIFKSTSFRRMFLAMFAISFIYPFLLWQAKTIWFFLFVMAVWAIYFDLYGFGVFDFVGRHVKKTNHASGFGIIQIVRGLGATLAPLIGGLMIINATSWRNVFALDFLFLSIGFVFFVVLLILTRKSKPAGANLACRPKRKKLFPEIYLWKKLGKLMLPVLLMTFYLFFIEAFFWTLAPLYAESTDLKQFSGLFLAAYVLPTLIVGWFVGALTKRFGKKRTAFAGLLAGSLILTYFFHSPGSVASIILVFFASLFISAALPAINAAYADYISEAPQVEGEMQSLEDFAFNIGYIAGPFSAGVLADNIGMGNSFGLVGLLGVVLAFILLRVTPKNIAMPAKL